MARKKLDLSNDPVLVAFDATIRETRNFTTMMRKRMGKQPRTLATLAAKKGQKRTSNRQLTEAQQAAFTSAGDGGTDSRAVERTFWQPEF
jgi:hypothetical protein